MSTYLTRDTNKFTNDLKSFNMGMGLMMDDIVNDMSGN